MNQENKNTYAIMLLLLQWNNPSWKKTFFMYKVKCIIINLNTEQPIENHLGYWMKNNYTINNNFDA